MKDGKRQRLTFNANAMAFGQQDDAEGELREGIWRMEIVGIDGDREKGIQGTCKPG